MLASAIVLCVGCGASNSMPLGGPYGGTQDPELVGEGGVIGDGDGVLDPGTSSGNGSIAADSGGLPTWTHLYDAYFVAGTIGNCIHCHKAQMGTASASFSWLQAEGYVGGSNPALDDPSSSCLSWLGGTMPPGGPTTNKTAQRDLDTWARAGAKNN